MSMASSAHIQPGIITETIRGVVDRVTYHNSDTGWSVLRVSPFNTPHQQETVIVHQTRVFAGATMHFTGAWTMHPEYGRQFRAKEAVEIRPATSAALEKYLGSGLIKGVGPKTAKKIVGHFKDQTLDIFENRIERLTEVPGIAKKKLAVITEAWQEHIAIRDVMMFLQTHGISTLFAVRIYKVYGDEAIAMVVADPYRLAIDFYGIGFFSADKVALSIGFDTDSPMRITAAIRHVLADSRQFGHCYLTESQITEQVTRLLELDLAERMPSILEHMQQEGLLMVREPDPAFDETQRSYYARSLYYDEWYVAQRIAGINATPNHDRKRIARWIDSYTKRQNIRLSDEQKEAAIGVACETFSVLTGGPGCGKTTTTLVIVKLLEAMGLRVMLAAPTGRAAQRMSEVIGKESKTIHRLLVWQNGKFKKNEDTPLETDFLIVDECSMLDISLTASLLKAVPGHCQVLFVGDADQLPSVGAGNVLRDIIASGVVPCFILNKIFRQAQKSLIIKYAHHINHGEIPLVDSPFKKPEVWRRHVDCLFIDSEEATKEQLGFIYRAKKYLKGNFNYFETPEGNEPDPYLFGSDEPIKPFEPELIIPEKFQHVDLEALGAAQNSVSELMAVLKKVHPWSSLHYGLSATAVIQKLYLEWIPKYYGENCEIQILSPMTRGSIGTLSLNQMIQESANPAIAGKRQLKVGERVLREGDRVIHRRNNYNLGVFNGDIGIIDTIDIDTLTCTVRFFPDDRMIIYQRDDIVELDLAYAVTIHKSQGSEFEAVIIPIFTQHFKMLFRNLVYTGLTRARKLAVFVGTRRALSMAVKNLDTSKRQTALRQLLITDKK